MTGTGTGTGVPRVERMPRNQTKKWLTVATVFLMVLAVILCIWGWRAGLFTSAEKMNEFLGKMGIWAPLIFLLIQIVQIVIPVIPGAVTCSVGVLFFGPWAGYFYNYIGIVVGSFLAFLLARRYGHPLIKALASEKTYDKYISWLDKSQDKFDKLFAIAIFLPFSPDDLLCMLAGVSKMSTKRLVWILILCKPLFLIPYSVGLPALSALLTGG